MDREEYAERVLQCVESVPPGRVTTYGAIAEVVGELLGGGGPRQVGSVLAHHGGPVAWWRVVRADGSPPACHPGEAPARYRAEGTPLRPSGKVDLSRALWRPPAFGGGAEDPPGAPTPGPGPAPRAGRGPRGRSPRAG